jgi:hypothetical protein
MFVSCSRIRSLGCGKLQLTRSRLKELARERGKRINGTPNTVQLLPKSNCSFSPSFVVGSAASHQFHFRHWLSLFCPTESRTSTLPILSPFPNLALLCYRSGSCRIHGELQSVIRIRSALGCWRLARVPGNFHHVMLLRVWEVFAADVGRSREKQACPAAPEGSEGFWNI